MLPEWMNMQDVYVPLKGGNRFAIKSMQSIGDAMARIQIQKGHEKGRTMPPLFKLMCMFCGILLISLTHIKLVIMAYAAGILLYLCIWPARDIARVVKSGSVASIITLVLLLPDMMMHPKSITNEIYLVIKVFLSVLTISIFNHTTQWNHITGALRQLHIPGIFVFTLDITLKYIVLLGQLISDLLVSVQLRSVGKAEKQYSSVGGVMGVTFLKGMEMNKEMYEAMQCRGFTDDYEGL